MPRVKLSPVTVRGKRVRVAAVEGDPKRVLDAWSAILYAGRALVGGGGHVGNLMDERAQQVLRHALDHGEGLA